MLQIASVLIAAIVLIGSILGAPDSGSDLPGGFDWRERDIMTPVKHQRDGGSCGEFAAVAVVEALIKKETGVELDLSEQQIVSCVPGCGCGSGCSSLDALKYIRDNGIVDEARLPYLGRDTTCDENLAGQYFISEVHSTTIDDLTLDEKVRVIKETVRKYGPVATNMAAYEDLDRYREGLYSYDGKSAEQGGHWVLIVGWQDDPTIATGGFWICRNSWGEKWGEKGYFNSPWGDVTGIDDFYIVYATYDPSKH